MEMLIYVALIIILGMMFYVPVRRLGDFKSGFVSDSGIGMLHLRNILLVIALGFVINDVVHGGRKSIMIGAIIIALVPWNLYYISKLKKVVEEKKKLLEDDVKATGKENPLR